MRRLWIADHPGRLAGLITVCLLTLGAILIWGDTTDMVPPVLPEIQKKEILPERETPLTPPALPEIQKKAVVPPKDEPLVSPDLPPIDRKTIPSMGEGTLIPPDLPEIKPGDFVPSEEIPLTPPQLPGIKRKSLQPPQITFLEQPNLPEIGFLQVQEFNDFRGGWNLSTYKTKLAPNEALELENALWNPQGEMYMRPGYLEHSTPPEVLNFLYRYYQQDGDKWTMGGSDTALYFWHEDTSGDGWTYLIGTEGTSGRWDGTTFEDMFVGTHEGIEPVIWDGESLLSSGVSVDSFQIRKAYSYIDNSGSCYVESIRVEFMESEGWETNIWAEYFLGLWADNDNAISDTCNARVHWYYALIVGNDDKSIYIRPPNFGFDYDIQLNSYARIYSWFGIDSVWREGQLDSATDVCDGVSYEIPMARLFDEDFYWDSTFNYKEYIFEVTGGLGSGKTNFLWNFPCAFCTSAYDTSAFFISGFDNPCFDSTTRYRIYKPMALTYGAKFCENFDDRLWLGWTGLGEEQDKNVIVYSELNSFGNWPPENEVYLTPGDGDWITGMISLSDARHVDVPTHLLMVTKNASSYKIVPTSTAGLYDSWYISTRIGCVSNSAMAVGEGLVLFPDQDGVWAWDQRSRPQCISLLIDPIFEAWNFEELEKVSAVYNPQDRHYYISLPVDIDTVINGGFITTFYRDSSGFNNQFVHLITTLGGEQDGDIEITEDTASAYCDIASDTLGNYVVLIKKVLNLFLFRFDSLDQRVGATIKVNDADDSVCLGQVHVDMNNNGQIVAVWEDFRNKTSITNSDIYGQCFRFDDGKVGNNFVVNSNYATNIYDSQQASVAINDDSICVFAWQDWNDTTGFQTCIFAAIDTFPISGIVNDYFKPFGGWKNPNGTCELVQEGPQGACANAWYNPDVDAGDTTFVIVCSDDPMEEYIQCIVMNYDLDTLMLNVISQVEMNGSGHPSVSMNKKGRFVVAYHHVSGLTNFRIWARKYDIGGIASGSYFRVDNNTDPAFLDSFFSEYPDVAINEEDQYCIVWWDSRCGDYNGVYYRCYTWEGGAVSNEGILVDMCGEHPYEEPEITATNIFLEIDTTKYTLAWSIDHHGWSKESFDASAYCYQHSIFDDVKILFADPEEAKVYNYGTQADDIDEPVILTYQTGYFNFSPKPSFETELKYLTIEAEIDTGAIYIDFYTDYGTLVSQDTINCGGDCRQELGLPDNVVGKNFSLKITTGDEIDEATLSGYWLEYLINQCRE